MTEKKRILLIDNEAGLCRMMEKILQDQGYQVKSFTSPLKAIEEFKKSAWDLVISDIKMPGMTGLEVLQAIKTVQQDIPVIMITAYATVETSIQALRRGAYDMLTKPFEPDELVYRVKNALQQKLLLEENRELRAELEHQYRFENIIGATEGLRDVVERVSKVAVRDTSILITGESGTGKELIAQAIHYNSPRREKKFVAINCGALPETLLESELFGYKKGAFTGATESRSGLLETANGGTLFLDEAGNLPMNVQKTLLRFLQEREFNRLGDTAPTRVDVRVLSATNSDLKEAIKNGFFREDLYYRLNVVNIHLPTLRERCCDIPLLAAHFIHLQNLKFKTAIKGMEDNAMAAMCEFSWPGNIRQLKNVIEACMTVETTEQITRETLLQFIESDSTPVTISPDMEQFNQDVPYTTALEQFEAELLRRLLKRHGGNIDAAAREAGMNMATMYRKIKRYGIRKE